VVARDRPPRPERRYDLGGGRRLSAWDSFGDAVNSLQLLGRCSDRGSFDGISYQLWFQSSSVSGKLHFGNPYRGDLIEIERAAFVLARGLREATQSPALEVCLEIWEQYLTSSWER
jgi:hypothetical protein